MTTTAVKAALLELILDSSGESSEDELIEHLLSDEEIPKIKNYIENVVHQYNDTTFQKFFRLRRNTCYELINEFARSEFCPKAVYQGGRGAPPEKHILCFLRFAGDKVPVKNIAELFDVSPSSACVMIHRVIDFLNALAPSIIMFPATAEERQNKADEFLEISNIDGIVGCIDGSYISIRTPENKMSSSYANRHDETSITLQGICDAKCKFLDCFTGVSGKIHDARIYSMSFVKRKVEEMGREYHILGDGAYPLSVNLLTPYRDLGNLTQEQINYNVQFSRCRVKIENAFGLLKGRFRQLLRLELTTVEKMAKFIIACCVLHNICIDSGDGCQEFRDYQELYVEPEEHVPENRRERNLGALKRDEIASML